MADARLPPGWRDAVCAASRVGCLIKLRETGERLRPAPRLRRCYRFSGETASEPCRPTAHAALPDLDRFLQLARQVVAIGVREEERAYRLAGREQPPSPSVLRAQLASLLAKIPITIAKIGSLFDECLSSGPRRPMRSASTKRCGSDYASFGAAASSGRDGRGGRAAARHRRWRWLSPVAARSCRSPASSIRVCQPPTLQPAPAPCIGLSQPRPCASSKTSRRISTKTRTGLARRSSANLAEAVRALRYFACWAFAGCLPGRLRRLQMQNQRAAEAAKEAARAATCCDPAIVSIRCCRYRAVSLKTALRC